MDLAWMRWAACRDLEPAKFFPSDGRGVEEAQAVCRECPARAACLEYALAARIEHGVWGGTSERERVRIRRRRAKAQSAAVVNGAISSDPAHAVRRSA